MLAKFLFTTVPGSILLGSLIISTSILVGSGYMKINSSAASQNINADAQAANPAQPSIQQQVQQPTNTAQPDSATTVEVNIADNPVLGDKNAKLTLVEFSDYECPFCKKSYDELIPELKKKYIDTGKLKLVYKDLPLPFHQNAVKEAQAARCARDQGGDNTYYKYHDQIFTTTTAGGTGLTLDQLPVLADKIGLDVTQFKKCLDNDKYKDTVNKDLAEAGKIGISGTPTWVLGKTTPGDFVEGTKIVGAQPFSTLSQLIDQQLSQ